MASGYGISLSDKELLIVAVVVAVAIAGIIYLVNDVPDIAASTIDSSTTAVGNIWQNLTGDTFGNEVQDTYNYFAGLFDY